MKRIEELFEPFIRKYRNKYDSDVARSLLSGGKDYSLNHQEEFNEPEYLGENIKRCVMSYTKSKNTAIGIFKAFVEFLKENGIEAEVQFPKIAVSNTFERQMFIAKYLQDESAEISDLPELLWISSKRIGDDLNKLRGLDGDPIRICGRDFIIEDTTRSRGRLNFASTVHPIFLTENLTQVIVLLKGLKHMAKTRSLADYANATAASVWQQLSDYAKKRIRYVLTELMPDGDGEWAWFEHLEHMNPVCFKSEESCSASDALMDCIKNEKPFMVEYRDGERTRLITNCRYIPGSAGLSASQITVRCDEGEVVLEMEKLIRVCYAKEEIF